MTMTATTSAPETKHTNRGDQMRRAFARNPVLGPTAALLVVMIFFSVATDTFLNVDNFSLIVQQSVVIGTLALGQTLIILTAGIDLANAAIAVFGTLLLTKLTIGGVPPFISILAGLVACTFIAMISGTLVTRMKLPPFIVTLGMLAVVTAVTNLYSAGTTYPVPDGLLTFLGTSLYLFGRIQFTMGMILAVILFVVMWFILSKTGWGRHVYAVGNNDLAAKRTGINVRRVLLSVYVLAGVLYGLAALQAFGRSPATSPNAFPTANLDTITAVVIGGTSLFGGRGTVLGSYLGALIVLVLQSGLTQAGIDPLYQNIVTGVLVIAAVALDAVTRRKAR